MHRREKREPKSTEERMRSLEEHIDNLTGCMLEIEVELKKRVRS